MLGNNKGIWLRQWGRQRSFVPKKQTLLEKCCLGSWRHFNQTWNLTAKRRDQDEGWLVSEDVRVVPGNGWTVDPVIHDHIGPGHRPQLKESWRVMWVDGMRLEVDGGREVPTTWGDGDVVWEETALALLVCPRVVPYPTVGSTGNQPQGPRPFQNFQNTLLKNLALKYGKQTAKLLMLNA